MEGGKESGNWEGQVTKNETETEECSVLLNGSLQGVVHDQEGESDPYGGEADGRNDEVIVEEEDTTANGAPDGGWGWLIVVGSLMIHVLIGGIERSAGIVFLKFDERFHQSAAVTAWSTSLPAGLRLTLGPFCSMLCNRFSSRAVVMTGAVILCISLVLTAFSPDIYFILFSFGIIGGIGRSFTYPPAVVMVGQYFNKRRGLAVGIATSGVGFGAFVFPTFIEVLFSYYGFVSAFMLLGAVMLNIMVFGSLFRPLWLHVKMTSRKTGMTIINLPEKTALHQQEQSGHIGSLHGRDQTFLKENPQETTSKVRNIISWFSKKPEGKPKTKLIDLSLFKDYRFSSFCAAMFLFTIAFQTAWVFLPPFAKQKGMDDYEATYTVAIAGLFDGVSRIISGTVLDLKRVKQYRIYVYNAVMFLLGTVCFVVPQLNTFTQLCIACSIYGALTGIYISQKSVVIVDILGVEKLTNSFGLMLCFQGLGMFVGPPISGLMKDINGHFNDGFYFGGASMICGALILVVANAYHHMKQTSERNKV